MKEKEPESTLRVQGKRVKESFCPGTQRGGAV